MCHTVVYGHIVTHVVVQRTTVSVVRLRCLSTLFDEVRMHFVDCILFTVRFEIVEFAIYIGDYSTCYNAELDYICIVNICSVTCCDNK